MYNPCDPAVTTDDLKQDAEVAMRKGRLRPEGVPTALRNASHTIDRKRKRRAEHMERLYHHTCNLREGRGDPAELTIVAELAEAVVGKLYVDAPQLLCTLLLYRAGLGLSRAQVAAITGQSEGTVSRASKRASVICQHLDPFR